MSESGNNYKCRIVVDAMGGDFAPRNAVIGALEALEQNSNINLLLAGRKKDILDVLNKANLSFPEENIIHTDEVIEMGDSPTSSLKSKPNSSIVVGAKLVRDKKADAFVSAGNTGAMMSASTLIMGRIAGVGRPTIGAAMPNQFGVCYLYDVGAGKDAKPIHLLEYAIMGAIYAKEMDGVANPKVGVLSMGEEESKGSELSMAAYNLIKQTKLNFVGNVEGRDILNGEVDVVVCDGFVGNIILKFGEGVLNFLKFKFKNFADAGIMNKLKIGLVKGTLKNILKDFDYQEHGGVPLLGVNGISIIGHGSSTAKAIRNMVLKASEMHEKKLLNKIEKSIQEYSKIN